MRILGGVYFNYFSLFPFRPDQFIFLLYKPAKLGIFKIEEKIIKIKMTILVMTECQCVCIIKRIRFWLFYSLLEAFFLFCNSIFLLQLTREDRKSIPIDAKHRERMFQRSCRSLKCNKDPKCNKNLVLNVIKVLNVIQDWF